MHKMICINMSAQIHEGDRRISDVTASSLFFGLIAPLPAAGSSDQRKRDERCREHCGARRPEQGRSIAWRLEVDDLTMKRGFLKHDHEQRRAALHRQPQRCDQDGTSGLSILGNAACKPRRFCSSFSCWYPAPDANSVLTVR